MKLCFCPTYERGSRRPDRRPRRAQACRSRCASSRPDEHRATVTRVMSLLGPGDVIAIEPRQVLRVTPAPARAMLSRNSSRPSNSTRPICRGLTARSCPRERGCCRGSRSSWSRRGLTSPRTAGQPGQSPWILRMPSGRGAARAARPGRRAGHGRTRRSRATDAAQVADTLANHPDRTLSRLLAPRQLLPVSRAITACVVPAFLSGRIAGLGRDPAGDPAARDRAANRRGVPSNLRAELPVYYSWTFRTGEAGDFESLARRLHAAPLDASIPPTPLHLSLPTGDGTLDRRLGAAAYACAARSTARPRRPAAAVAQIRSVLTASSPTRRVLGPTYFGAPWIDGRPLTPVTQWAPSSI